MKPRHLALIIGLLSPAALARQQTSIPPGLDRAQLAYDHAQSSGDRAALKSLLAPDYLILSGSGKLHDKAWLIQSFCAPGVHNNPFTVLEPFTRILSPGSAILGGWAELSGTENGKPFSQKLRFADTWVRRNGHWQVVFTSVAESQVP